MRACGGERAADVRLHLRDPIAGDEGAVGVPACDLLLAVDLDAAERAGGLVRIAMGPDQPHVGERREQRVDVHRVRRHLQRPRARRGDCRICSTNRSYS